MTPDEPLSRRGSQFLDSNDDVEDVSSTTESYKWSLDDVEGGVVDLLDDIVAKSAGQAIEKVMNNRLFRYVAHWGLSIIEEVLASAIAPTGDTVMDSNDRSVLNDSRALLGRCQLPLENLSPPMKCPLDVTYQRRQVPIRAPTRDNYDSEALHHAVKAATRSQAHPASITSSRVTGKSKVRKKHTAPHVESTGPQPGVPYSTEVHDPHKHRHAIISPRKVIPAQEDEVNSSPVGAGLLLNIDTDARVASPRSRRSPPPLSKSPSSISSGRRPHPPGAVQNGREVKTLRFGEKEEEVKVEYVVQKSPSQKHTTRNALPYIDNGKITPRANVPYPAFSNFGSTSNDGEADHERDNSFGEDPADQQFLIMPLSPGVKVRAGEEANNGPELPLFASRMSRSTFVRMETCTLATQLTSPPRDLHARELGKAVFLTETAWEFSAADKGLSVDQTAQSRSHHFGSDKGIKADDVSSAELTTSCSCSSSSSLTLFRKQSKVSRPCRSCKNPSTESKRKEPMNFSNLVKQRAFHLKPPSLPTSSSPSKRAPGASPRRVASAPASSPLARRNLLISKSVLPGEQDRSI